MHILRDEMEKGRRLASPQILIVTPQVFCLWHHRAVSSDFAVTPHLPHYNGNTLHNKGMTPFEAVPSSHFVRGTPGAHLHRMWDNLGPLPTKWATPKYGVFTHFHLKPRGLIYQGASS